jgi:hypothetical protein
MINTTILMLVVIPAIYSLWKEREVRRRVTPGHRGSDAGRVRWGAEDARV